MATNALRAIFLLTFVTAVPRPASAQTPAKRTDRDTTSTVSAVLSDHETGEPIGGALVRLISGTGKHATFRTRVTNAQGRFFFTNIPSGHYELRIARYGYRQFKDTVSLPPGDHVRMLLQLSSSPVQLQPVIVVVHPYHLPPGPVPGLELRERRGLGTILTRKKIDSYHAFEVTDLLRTVPGVRIVPNDDLSSSIELRGGCKPAIWVDGNRTDPQDIDLTLQPSDLQAVEVYQASEVPVQFATNSCGAVLFWTRPAEGNLRFSSWWKKLIIPAAILIAAIIKLH